MFAVIDALMDAGGVATTAQLRALGIERDELDVDVMYRKVIRVRKGLWALPRLPRDVMSAKRIGGVSGRVACLSALILHGAVDEVSDAVHVEVPHNASRLRHAPLAGRAVVIHWTREPVGDGRLVVPLGEAVRQFEQCEVAQATSR